ncbi:Hsp33 family molecular chaperone HslO [Chitinivibrio alkaliphilus]|uniref:Hsp33 protein n=1 Tax=Chitinivibrio alkaliphilus ACht1 TaxID=1313304 RepID=U7DCN7_9BACT|nr:Hsp33 family molecular chaperone HslO [Chitinivibrio alkaliphilus]ERP39318.1 Hsp33 protein [Chitinivibrio alkaliphilus ACht1]
MAGTLLTSISQSGGVRCIVANTTDPITTLFAEQKPATLSGIMLGRALTAAALMGSTMKTGQRVGLVFEGAGPLGKIVTEGDAQGHIRGVVHNDSLDFNSMTAVDEQIRTSLGVPGILSVVKDMGLKTPYRGSVALQSGEIGDDLAHYLTESEQIPSAVSVGVIPDVDGVSLEAAGGFLVQALPNEGGRVAPDEIESISEFIEKLPPVTELLRQGAGVEELTSQIFGTVPYTILGARPVTYSCLCNRKKSIKRIAQLPSSEIADIFDRDTCVEIQCEYCKKTYTITEDEVKGYSP